MARPAWTPTKGGQAAVAAGELHVGQPGRDRIHYGAAVTLDAVADQPERASLEISGPRELGPFPVPVDHRLHLGGDELPGPCEVVQLGRGELLAM